ncbi:MAG: hypothetical protein WCK24_03900, partial [Actinomycetes bacterium]
YTVSGADDLQPGSNDVTVTVTAANGTSSRAYVVVVTVPTLSADTSLSGITVDGSPVVDGLVSKAHGTTSVDVVATPTSDKASARVTGSTGLHSGSNIVTVIVTAENGTEASQTFTVEVGYSSDSSLASILANGYDVSDNGSVDFETGTTSITVVAIANDVDATVEVTGNTGLGIGANLVTVKIIAADGSFTNYSFTANILVRANNADLSALKINGQDALANSTITVLNSVSEAVVVAATVSPSATYRITSGTSLDVGSNQLQIVVTAEDGTERTYDVTVIRSEPLSANANLDSITVNAEEHLGVGFVVEVAYGTSSVDVSALTEDAAATYEVVGNTSLKTGDNIVRVIITAENGDSASYVFTVRVALSDNANASGIKVNGSALSLDDLNFTVSSVTTSVSVAATTEDIDATYAVTGADALDYGDNSVVVTVTAANGVASREYTINVVRTPLSSNTNLSSIRVNGTLVEVDGTFPVDAGTTSVSVTATAEDADATTEVSGNDELVPGSNLVTVTVFAASGASKPYTFTVFVNSLSSDSTLKSITIDGNETSDGATVTLDGTKNFVSVVAVANDANAEVAVTGAADLNFGTNLVTVVVTAEDGTFSTYTVTVVFPNILDTSLATFTVNGDPVENGQTVNLDSGVTEVTVVALATDPAANVEISGGTDLAPGENTLTVTVTAADGATVQEYNVTLLVALSSNTKLSSFQVNGEDVVDGGTFPLDAYTTSAEITAEAEDPDAKVVITGADALESGENLVTVVVTAADGVTTDTYTVTLIVALGNDVTFSSFQINGEDVEDGGEVTLAPLTEAVEVTFVTTDIDATYVISGDTDLVNGPNVLTVTVTAADGVTTVAYSVTLIVPLNNDATLSEFSIDGNAVLDGDIVPLEYGTSEVAVVATPTDANAAAVIEGGMDLVSGENTVTVTVTAADGDTVATYSVTLMVAFNNDTTLATFTVNDSSVVDGDVVELAPYTTDVTVVVEPTDPNATFTVEGGTDLVAGENALVVTVVAADGETTDTYTVTLNVLLSSDTSLATFTVNDVAVEDGSVVELDAYTTEVTVVVETTDENSTFTVDGGTELVAGENTLVVTVTAADGSSLEYNVVLNVALGNNVELSTFTVNDSEVADGDNVELAPYTTEVTVDVATVDPDATFTIDGGTDLLPGVNTLTVVVTAADGVTTATSTVTLTVALGNNVELSTFQVNGAD